MHSILSALDRRCDAVLGAWYKDETSNEWGLLSYAEKSAARSLLRMMENVFKVFYDGKGLEDGLEDANFGEAIGTDYHKGWRRFIADIETAVKCGLSFNGMCATLYLRLHSTDEEVVVDETTLRPCAIGHVFLECALFHICTALIWVNERTIEKKRLRIVSSGIRGQMVEDALINTRIKNSGWSVSMQNEWIVAFDQLNSVMQRLAEKSKVKFNPNTEKRESAPLISASELNQVHTSVTRDATITAMIKRSVVISSILNRVIQSMHEMLFRARVLGSKELNRGHVT